MTDQATAPLRAARRATAIAPGGVELTVVAPTFNERSNVARLVEKLDATLAGVTWEVIFVDDNSPDGTAAVVKEIAARDSRVRCLRRVGRRGLAGAVTEGALASAAPFVAVIDADMQHDETLLPRMLGILRSGDTDLVVGSRYLEAAGLEHGLSPGRKAASQFANALGRKALKADVSDPVSGFFMIRREAIDRVADQLEPSGFKILFDIIASQPQPLRVKELPYAFAAREAGVSKLDNRVALEYLGLVASKLSRGLFSPRIIFFGLVGVSGLLVHMSVLWAAHGLGPVITQTLVRQLGLNGVLTRTSALWAAQGFGPAVVAQGLAGITAMTSNYFINNVITYRDKRLKGWKLFTGYLRFCALCTIGLVASIGVNSLLLTHGVPWPIAGLVGAVSGAIWNYVSTYLGVW